MVEKKVHAIIQPASVEARLDSLRATVALLKAENAKLRDALLLERKAHEVLKEWVRGGQS